MRPTSFASEADMKPGNRKGTTLAHRTAPGEPDAPLSCSERPRPCSTARQRTVVPRPRRRGRLVETTPGQQEMLVRSWQARHARAVSERPHGMRFSSGTVRMVRLRLQLRSQLQPQAGLDGMMRRWEEQGVANPLRHSRGNHCSDPCQRSHEPADPSPARGARLRQPRPRGTCADPASRGGLHVDAHSWGPPDRRGVPAAHHPGYVPRRTTPGTSPDRQAPHHRCRWSRTRGRHLCGDHRRCYPPVCEQGPPPAPSRHHQSWLGTVLSGACYGLLGVALGALTRNTVAAIVGGLVWIQLVEVGILENAIPSVAKRLPVGAAQALTTVETSPQSLSQGVAALVLVGWAAFLVAIATRLSTRRELR